MNLHEVKKGGFGEIRRLYVAAFPREERAPFFLIKKRALQNRATMLAAKDEGGFVGFAYTIVGQDSVYLFYLAVAANRRGRGNGGEILQLIKEYYKGKQIFLAREPIDDEAENARERVSRRNFYLSNGFVDLPFQVREANVVFDLMGTSDRFVPDEYNSLVKGWAGDFVLEFVKMELVE